MVPDMISVSALPQRYGDVRAVDDLSFDVERGEVIGLLGAIGAGKVTPMRMVTGAGPLHHWHRHRQRQAQPLPRRSPPRCRRLFRTDADR
jgi:ABC-type branched-subunit amino acid transport system ATPase component